MRLPDQGKVKLKYLWRGAKVKSPAKRMGEMWGKKVDGGSGGRVEEVRKQ